jgi:hypothetical protein
MRRDFDYKLNDACRFLIFALARIHTIWASRVSSRGLAELTELSSKT